MNLSRSTVSFLSSSFTFCLPCALVLTVALLSPTMLWADGLEEPSSTADGAAQTSKANGADKTAKGEKTAQAEKEAQDDKAKGPRLSEFDLARYQYCGSDRDCVIEINGCCECETGGQEVAINKGRVEAFRANFKECKNIACSEVLEQNHCGGGVVTCVEHRCKFIAAEEQL